MTVPRIDRPVIERLTVRNYRVLRDVTFDRLSPLTVLFGPNGSGKSTVFDVFAFLHEAFRANLRDALVARGGMAHIRSRGEDGPVGFDLRYREDQDSLPVMYTLKIDEVDGLPVVVEEQLRATVDPRLGRPNVILEFRRGAGTVYDGSGQVPEKLASPDLLAVSTLGQLGRYPQVAALRRFITGWYMSHFRADNARLSPPDGGQKRLSESGDNLANVIRYLQDRHPDRLDEISRVLAERVPGLDRIETTSATDGRLLLRLKDRPFTEPIVARYASEGTLKLLAYLTVLYDPEAASIIGIEEPENHLDGRLLYLLAEEARGATERSQLLATTHSAYFGNALRPHEFWALYRDERGFTRSVLAADIPKVVAMFEAGGLLGSLWMEGYFGLGDPLVRAGRPR